VIAKAHRLSRTWGWLASLALALYPAFVQAQNPVTSEEIVVDTRAPGQLFPHFWEQMFGSGRAILSLRDSYRRDLRAVKKITDLRYVRFHAILHDEVGVYDEDASGQPIYNFSYVDQIYDGLLAEGVKPFVEIGFMPAKLAAKEARHSFWYKPVVAPPKDWNKWDDMVAAFARHLLERYGTDQVSQWYFEVWNEPNLDFWAGEPKQSSYWELYDHTARALKNVSSRLRVGGPATAQAAWVDAFIQHCAANRVPVDFVSTHVYGDDTAQDVFDTNQIIPRDKMVCRAVRKVHDQIKSSAMPSLPLIWSEFNATYKTLTEITDSSFMGPWLADTIRQCDGLTQMMSYWTFSDVFEEQGVVKTPFYGGYGLIAAGGIPKPAFNVFQLLHRLGDRRLPLDSSSAIATRRDDGAIVVAVWNYVPPDQAGSQETISLRFLHSGAKSATVSRVDPDHGDFHFAYEKMGSPRYPNQAQIAELQRSAALPPPQKLSVDHGRLSVTLPAHGLAMIELQ